MIYSISDFIMRILHRYPFYRRQLEKQLRDHSEGHARIALSGDKNEERCCVTDWYMETENRIWYYDNIIPSEFAVCWSSMNILDTVTFIY